MRKILKSNEIPEHIKMMPDGRPQCWEYDYLLRSDRCGMCPACHGWIMDFQLTPPPSPPKEKSYRLWG